MPADIDPSLLATDPSPDLERDLARLVAERSRQLHERSLLLYAGASLLDAHRAALMSPDLSALPAMGPPEEKEQPGSAAVAALEVLTSGLACEVFGAQWAEVRLPSCTIANLAVFSFFRKRGGVMLAPAACDGGHLSQRRGGTPELAGFEVRDLPFDAGAQTLEPAKAAEMIEATSPALVMLGRSVILGPDELAPVVAAARKVGAVTVYDASHVAGLIAGGAFPNPFDVGVDLMTTSTYKTLCGPTGGLVMGQDPAQGEAFARFVDGAFLANQDASRFPALASALNAFRGRDDYAQRVVEAAQQLKNAFLSIGLPVLAPEAPAGSHQVVVPIGSPNAAVRAMKSLEAAGLLVGHCPLPGVAGRAGLRFGTQVAVARGFSPALWPRVAKVVSQVLRACEEDGAALPAQHATLATASREVAMILSFEEAAHGGA